MFRNDSLLPWKLIFVLVAVVGWLAWCSHWYTVFIVGQYYDNGGLIQVIILGGSPLWLAIILFLLLRALFRSWKA